ncbi:MAG: flagellar hook-length control protein FliK [Deltaproteobacteria bacterium]|nr:flagellar hook-length control protein FliK [Deltaproteobacteria bacterium]
MRLAVHRGGERVTVQLEPEHLGRIHVEVVREGGRLSAQIRVETPQAHQLLAAELPALRAAAEARQVPLIHVTVELDHGQGRGEGGDPGPRRRHRRPAGGDPVEEEVSVGTSWMPWGFEARI